VYGAASVIAALVAAGREVPRPLLAGLASLAIVWASAIAAGGPDFAEYARMFDGWEMASISVEEAREASGLLIVGFWMTVLFVRAGRRWRPEVS
jgi:hypothetical protein